MAIAEILATVAPAVISAGAGIFGAVQSAREKKKMSRYLDDSSAENEDFFNSNYYSDFTNRRDVSALMSQVRDNLKKNNSQTRNSAVVTGATDEAIALEKANNAAVIADTTGKIASAQEVYKDNILNNYQNRKQNIMNMKMDMANQQAENASKLSSNALSGLNTESISGIMNLFNNKS